MYNRPFRNAGNRSRFSHSNRFSRRARPVVDVRSYIKRATVQTHGTIESVSSTMRFEELPINSKLKQNIVHHGYTTLMPIQEKGIPAILEGKDVIGIANTGTGKTAAFIIPLVEFILKDPTYRALIITPTRELALQIREELRQFTQQLPVYGTFCIGQSSMRNQIYDLKRNPHVVVGTPGRLKDLIERRILNLSMYRMIVLDEVDRMLDMGFVHDVKHIVSFLPAKRQSLFFSATLSPQINTIIQSFVKNPVMVSVKKTETTSHIRQDLVRYQPHEPKLIKLHQLLEKKDEFKKVLVFGRTKLGVERLSRDLYQKGHKVASIHGNKPQFKRQEAIRMFKEDVVHILVATDVAARGLDIADITHVINYDAPATYEDYIHRIGRTGRANKDGIALTFIEDRY